MRIVSKLDIGSLRRADRLTGFFCDEFSRDPRHGHRYTRFLRVIDLL